MTYQHMEIDILQQSKRPAEPCGDVAAWEKNRAATTLVLCDGLGAGIYANLSARFAAERLLTLIRQEFSARDAFLSVVESMHQAKQDHGPYAALTLCRILNDGQVTVLSYESPSALALENRYAYVLPRHRSAGGSEVISESRFHMEKGASLILLSDGVTQAGMGKGLATGWGENGVAQHLNRCFREGAAAAELPARIYSHARRLDQNTLHDDLSIVWITARKGHVVNILSGPPADRGRDEAVAKAFLEKDGIKVICGATTALLAARAMKRDLKMEPARIGYVEPPRYQLPGVDLTTEGAITLNQVCNLLDADEEDLADNQSGVAGLCKLLRFADRVNWIVGTAVNPAHGDIRFAQMGVWPRHKIIPQIADKLRAEGKLVVLEYV